MTRHPMNVDDSCESVETSELQPDGTIIQGAKRIVYFVLAGVFFVLGVAGALLPILPATPFLLLTSYFLVRISPRLNARLLRSRFFGPILTDWQVNGGVRPDVKAKAIVIVLMAVAGTVYLTGASWIPTLVVSALAGVGILVILSLPRAG